MVHRWYILIKLETFVKKYYVGLKIVFLLGLPAGLFGSLQEASSQYFQKADAQDIEMKLNPKMVRESAVDQELEDDRKVAVLNKKEQELRAQREALNKRRAERRAKQEKERIEKWKRAAQARPSWWGRPSTCAEYCGCTETNACCCMSVGIPFVCICVDLGWGIPLLQMYSGVPRVLWQLLLSMRSTSSWKKRLCYLLIF